MSAEAAAVAHSFPVGRRTCSITLPTPREGCTLAMMVEWAPDAPHRLSHSELRQYRAGRNAAVAELARITGLQAAVVEVT